jgi:hypothetical protein
LANAKPKVHFRRSAQMLLVIITTQRHPIEAHIQLNRLRHWINMRGAL